MHMRLSKEDGLRVWGRSYQVLEFKPHLTGLGLYFETPTTWHEDRRLLLAIHGFLFSLYIGLPWFGKIAPDYMQCCGPMYGFQFHSDLLWIYFGQDSGGILKSRSITIYMPWSWNHVRHEILSEPETHPYTYRLRSGEIQERTATIQVEEREWRRKWLPWRKVNRYIEIQFDDEVGERTGSWKGGTIGCSYRLLPHEQPIDALRHMERERKL